MEHIPTWTESQYKKQMKPLVVPAQESLANMTKIQGHTEMHVISFVRLRLAPHTVP